MRADQRCQVARPPQPPAPAAPRAAQLREVWQRPRTERPVLEPCFAAAFHGIELCFLLLAEFVGDARGCAPGRRQAWCRRQVPGGGAVPQRAPRRRPHSRCRPAPCPLPCRYVAKRPRVELVADDIAKQVCWAAG